MSDNWTSFVSLVNRGDWARWDLTLDSTSADALNQVSGPAQVFVRYAVTSSGDVNQDSFVVMVNDWLVGIENFVVSPTTWNDPGRFAPFKHVVSTSNLAYQAVAFSNGNEVFFAAPFATAGRPWKVGANTMRVLNKANVPVDIDFVGVGNTVGDYFTGNFFTAETVPAGFASHVNGTAFNGVVTWFLKGPDGTTGSGVGTATIDFEKLCPTGNPDEYTIRVHIHDGATNAGGDVGVIDNQDGSTVVRATLDGTGRATLVAIVPNVPIVWYGGSDEIAPEMIIDFPLDFVGCGGWYVGQIGMG